VTGVKRYPHGRKGRCASKIAFGERFCTLKDQEQDRTRKNETTNDFGSSEGRMGRGGPQAKAKSIWGGLNHK